MNPKEPVEKKDTRSMLRWDLIGMTFTALLAILLIFLFDTGPLAEWIAKHKHTKVDEIVFAGVALLAVLGLFATRKWLGLSRLLVRYEESPRRGRLPEMNRVKTAQQRDLFAVGLALLSSFI